MKCWVRRIFLCTLLSVVTTVAVAWGVTHFDTQTCWQLGMVENDFDFVNSVIRAHTAINPRDILGWYDLSGHESVRFGVRRNIVRSMITPTFGDIRTAVGVDITERFAGWPMYALNGTYVGHHGEEDYLMDGWNYSGNPIDPDAAMFFPLRPMIPGFMVNALFYGAIWFVLIFGIAMVRRTIRRRRGRCPRCGYDLRGSVTNGRDVRSTNQDARSTGCPECGRGRTETGA